MLLYLSQLLGLRVHSIDAVLGKLCDFYFDDKEWTITDLVVNKHFATHSKKILIPLVEVKTLENEIKKIELNITKSRAISNSDVSNRNPISHTDYELARIFGWPNLWSISDAADSDEGLLYSNTYTPHLRSIQEVTGYCVRKFDKDDGYISDFLIDKNNWTIKNLIVTKRKFFPGGKKIIIGASNINLDLKYPTAILAA